jgi:hypothetical protein
LRRPTLSYANVVSTICLFAILGGGAYAASKISGGDIKSRTIAGKKLKRDTVTGKEVDEGKLATVPTATEAANAASAANAELLGGLDPASFIRSDRMAFGTAALGGSGTEILRLPGFGLTVLTGDDPNPDPDPDLAFVLRNDRSPGGGNIDYSASSFFANAIAPGATAEVDGLNDVDFLSAYVVDANDRTKALLLECRRIPVGQAHIGCFALLAPNAPG